MTEVKSTKGIEKNMHEEIENLVRKAYNEGFVDGKNAVNSLNSCSWEKGVTDAWECMINTLNMMGKDNNIKADDRAVMIAMAHTFETSDPIGFTKSYVDIRNIEEDEEDVDYEFNYVEEDELEVGDLVIDPSGNECIVTNIDTHIHVIYTDNLKTHKWKLDTEFKPTGLKIVGFGRIDR